MVEKTEKSEREVEMREPFLEKKPRERKVVMRSGLEIHQQLDTGKLFCRCPSILLAL